MDEDREEATLLTVVHTREQPLRKLEKSVALVSWGSGGGPVDESTAGAAMTDLARFELQTLRAKNASIAAVREIEASEAIRRSLEELAKEREREIRELRIQLERERISKANRERYSALAKVISAITPRSVSQREIEAVSEKIAELESQGEALALKKDTLGKHFLLLAHTLEDVTQLLQDESEQSLSPAIAKQSSEAEDGEAADEQLEEGEEGGNGVAVGERMEVEEGEEEEEEEEAKNSPHRSRMDVQR